MKSFSGNFLEANLDTYEGNSGSMVVNSNTLQVEGILVTGNTDYIRNGTCCVSNSCPNTGCSGSFEGITKIVQVATIVKGIATTGLSTTALYTTGQATTGEITPSGLTTGEWTTGIAASGQSTTGTSFSCDR